ncbi:ATP-dependent endonuclease [Rhodopirellula sp. SWK7]|uniref:ATP-dependent endonuclease n=1 Tax=Rhodopirellula sp. SWK7 TaxID=595460 RepID=UPI001F2EB760|nr:ATP-dependent endonuclease [Rhodopirellula sp. SWK7]
MLFVVEGTNDIEFLRRISILLHADAESLPNLAEMEQHGELIFVPFGGGHVRAWSQRLAPLQRAEFHLYDHELPPETELRRQAAETVNRRSRCQAVLTNKRCLENYLHPDAIFAASGIRVDFDDFDCVAEIVARKLYQQRPGEIPWQLQARRSQSRMANRAKRWLNTTVVEQMTRDMLRESDPNGEIQSWLLAIKDLLAA